MAKAIDLIDVSLLKLAAPQNTNLSMWVQPIKDACVKFNIDTIREVACFLGQAGHESVGFTHLTENLNYSKPERLMQVWPKRFPTMAIAREYAGNPEKLANYVYANRMGNGPPESGDGWRYRGSGLFQLTGRDNYQGFARVMSMTPGAAADYIRTSPIGAAMSAAWFFDDRGIDALAATPGVEDETRRINGGVLGLAERKAHFDAIVAELIRRGA